MTIHRDTRLTSNSLRSLQISSCSARTIGSLTTREHQREHSTLQSISMVEPGALWKIRDAVRLGRESSNVNPLTTALLAVGQPSAPAPLRGQLRLAPAARPPTPRHVADLP